ncbi:MAG: hypothetical protein MUE61_08400 [Vicinamibacterales bacterium]|jgi:hypothetical protein|nr:hypothetical protein [Vicinamibacterales bacterium]MCU0477185.1 hypothetical protein [Chloroflexota bacterium]MCU0562332.1 hypothetical protein [Desulfobacterales bacterium]
MSVKRNEYDYFGNPVGSAAGIANLAGGNTYDYLEELRSRVTYQEDYVRRLREADLQRRLDSDLRGGTFRGNYGTLTAGGAGVPSGPSGGASPIASTPWSDPVSFSLGNTNPYIQTNALLDPWFDGFVDDLRAELTTSYSTLSSVPYGYGDPPILVSEYAWRGKKSGSGTANVWQDASRIRTLVNPFASGVITLMVTGASGTTEAIVESNTFDMSYGKYVPYLVASAVITGAGYGNNTTNITSARLYIEIVEYQGSGTVKASTYIDLLTESPTGSKFRRFWSSVLSWSGSNNNVMRLRLEVVGTGTGGTIFASVAEPYLAPSWAPDPVPYNPIVGRVALTHPAGIDFGDEPLATTRKTGDAAARLALGSIGSVRWGPGSSVYLDARLWRSAAGVLTLDGAGPATTLGIPDLKGFWRFNEASGATAIDSVGTNNGTYNGTITQGVTGPVPGDPTSKGITLDGSTGYVSIPDHADIDLGDGPWTIFVRMTQDFSPPASRRQLLDKGTNAYGIYFNASSTAPRLEKVGEGDIAVYSSSVGGGAWNSFAFTKNGSSIGFWSSGRDRITSCTITNRTLSDTSSPLIVGRQQASSGYYDSSIADLAIFKRVLSSEELRLLHEQRLGGGPPTLDIVGTLKANGREIVPAAGFVPYAYMAGFNGAGTYTTALSLAANGGSIAIPIVVPSRMSLRQVSIWNTDTGSARSWNWSLYAQLAGNDSNTLNRVAVGSAAESYTATVGSKRTIAAASAPITLSPGLYWLVVQNNHSTNTFGLGSVATGTLSHNRAQTKTLTVPVGATLDFVAATWTKVTSIYPVVLEGDVFGQTAAF